MKFLYPRFDRTTHEVIPARNLKGVSLGYPQNSSFSQRYDVPVRGNGQIAVIEENIGYKCLWSLAKALDGPIRGQEFYILNKNLLNIGGKQSFIPICSDENSPKLNEPEINPYEKEVFVPYLDKKNGLYSVRIQTDYDKILDSISLYNLYHDVFYEGVSLLLESRGYRADNDYIKSLIEKYYTFAYINDDLAQTVNRVCENITFTVSIPLRFFNEEIAQQPTQQITTSTKKVVFSNYAFEGIINKLLRVLTSRTSEIFNLTYPNKFIEGFSVDFEVSSTRAFAVAASEFLAIAGFPLSPRTETILYEFGFNDDFDIQYVKVLKGNEEVFLNQRFIAQFRLRQEFSSKRMFNYIYNIKEMETDIINMDIKEFIDKYVNYPKPVLRDEIVRVNGKVIAPDKVAQYRTDFEKASNVCFTTGDINDIIRSVRDIQSYSDPIWHLFIKNDKKQTEKTPEQALASLAQTGDAAVTKVAAPATSTAPDAAPATTASTETNPESPVVPSEAEAPTTSKPPAAGGWEVVETSAEPAKPAPVPSIEIPKQTTGVEIQTQSLTDRTTASVIRGAEVVGEGVANASVDIAKGAAAGFTEETARLNINTLLYSLYRININELLFKQLFCALSSADPNNKEIADILSKIGPDILAYFNYLRANAEFTGHSYIKALEKGMIPDVKIFCAKNAGLIYFLKGLSKFVKFLNSTGQLITNIKNTASTSFEGAQRISPWYAFGKAVAVSIEQQLITEVFNILKASLQTTCDDPAEQTNNNNFRDPFNTHFPTPASSGGQYNSEFAKIRDNRRQVLDEVFAQTQYGFDREYTVDLIGRLIKDINCLLTPQESTQLLRGEPTDLIVTLVKNIIRTKYSTPPNDLSFLLNNDKLKQFFSQLGLTVDPGYLEIVTEVVSNQLSPSRLCSPQQLIARQELIKNKLPKELGVLEKQIDIRNRNAIRLFERIQNGSVVDLNINALCDDLENAEILAAKDKFLESLNNRLRSTFTSILSDFTQEVSGLPAAFTEERTLYRQKSNGNTFGTVQYYTYNSNLALNIVNIFNNPQNTVVFYDGLSEKNCQGYRIKYQFLSQQADLAQLAKVTLPSEDEIEIKFVCPATEQLDTGFLKFLRDGNIIIEFAQDFLFDGEGGFGEGSDLQELKNDFDIRYKTTAGVYLNSKPYFMTISMDQDGAALQAAAIVGVGALVGVAAAGVAVLATPVTLGSLSAGLIAGGIGATVTGAGFVGVAAVAGTIATAATSVALGAADAFSSVGEVDADEISFKLIFNDKANDSFRILSEKTYEEDAGDKSGLQFAGSDAFYNDMDQAVENIKNNSGYQVTFSLDRRSIVNEIKEVSKTKLAELRVGSISDDVYVLNELIFNNLTNNTKQLIQAIYLEEFKSKIEQIESFNKTVDQIQAFQNTGIFQSETLFPIDREGVVKKKIRFGHGEFNSETKVPSYGLVDFINIEYSGSAPKNFQSDEKNTRERREKAVLSVYEYFSKAPPKPSEESANRSEKTIFTETGAARQPIKMADIKEKYSDEIVSYLDGYVSVNDIKAIKKLIVDELSNYFCEETSRTAIAEFDNLYLIDEDRETFLTELDSVDWTDEDSIAEVTPLIEEIRKVYIEGLKGETITRQEIIEYKNIAVDILDGYVGEDSVQMLYDMVLILSQRTSDGIPAIQIFNEEYAKDESGDVFINDLTNIGRGTFTEITNNQIRQMQIIFDEYGLNSYKSGGDFAKNIYFKTSWDISEFVFTLKEGESDWFSETPDLEKVTDETYLMEKNHNLNGGMYGALSKFTNLNYPKDQRFIRCGLNPHYLNLDYLLNLALDNQSVKLCDINNYDTNDILKTILVELTYRVYITDLLVKAIPYLASLSQQQLNDAQNNEAYIKIIKEFMKRELRVLTPETIDIAIADSIYSQNLFKITKEVYNDYLLNNKLKSVFINESDPEKEINYFIKKEINRFIKYCITYSVFSPYNGQTFEKFITDKFGSLNEEIIIFSKIEHETALAYFLAANTVDIQKRTIFSSTKSGLAQIFFSNIGNLTDLDQRESNLVSSDSSVRKLDDVYDFLIKLSFSANPAAMIITRPEYSKYAKEFLLTAGQVAKSTLEIMATKADKNIALTRQISNLLSFTSSTAWSLLDQQSRTSLIVNDGTLFYKRINDGKPPIPELITSLGVSAASKGLLWPSSIGWGYLAVDSVLEAFWYENARNEVNKLISNYTNAEPCDIPQQNIDTVVENIVCNDDTIKYLKDVVNSLENANSLIPPNPPSPAPIGTNNNTSANADRAQAQREGAARRAQDRRDGRSTNTTGINEDI